MPKVRFENGVTVNFDKTPTQQDIEEVAKKIALKKPVEAEQPKETGYFENAWDTVKKGASGMVDTFDKRSEEAGAIMNSDQNIVSKGVQMFGKGVQTGVSDIIGGVLDTGIRAITPDVIGAPIEKGIQKTFQTVGEVGSKVPLGYDIYRKEWVTPEKIAERYVDWETKHPEAAKNVAAGGQVIQGALDLAMTAQAGNSAVNAGKKVGTAVGNTVSTVAGDAKSAVNAVKGKVASKIAERKTPEFIIGKREAELAKLEDQYAGFRKVGEYSKDNLVGSRKRIASTDVLVDAVDETGTIRTKRPGGAVDQYMAQTIDGSEGVVRQNLERLGERVSLNNVEKALTQSVENSGLVGNDLTTALRNVKKEINGYARMADAEGKIPLTAVHDAKIGMAKTVNYQTPPHIGTYRKSIASGLKKVVEKYSSFDVKNVNAEIGKYLEDLKYLEMLDGKKVAGGKLGKYFSQISGNIIGATAGAAVGGIPGSAVGTIVGGEVGGLIKGKMMKGAFGKATGNVAPRSTVIDDAVKSANSPRLMLEAPKEGSPRSSMGSGPTINLPAKTPTLLDDTYSKSLGNRNAQYSNTAIANNTSMPQSVVGTAEKSSTVLDIKKPFVFDAKEVSNIGYSDVPANVNPLIQEARKYKSAEEFVKSHGAPLYHGTRAKGVIEKFDKEKIGSVGDNFGEAYYFTPDKKLALDYSFDIKGKIESDEIYKNLKKRGDIIDDKLSKLVQQGNGPTEVMRSLIKTKREITSASLKRINEIENDFSIRSGGNVQKRYVLLKNPLIVDAKGQNYNKVYPEIFKNVDKNKHDGIIFKNVIDSASGATRYPTEVRVAFSPEQIKTKSQLTDIWKQAHKK